MLSEVNCHREVEGSDYCRWAILHLQTNELSDVVKGVRQCYGAGSFIQLLACFRRSFIQQSRTLSRALRALIDFQIIFLFSTCDSRGHDLFKIITRIRCMEWMSRVRIFERELGLRIGLNRSEENHGGFQSTNLRTSIAEYGAVSI